MAIQGVGLISPQRKVEKKEERYDPWADIGKGLDIANGVFGLAVNYQKFNQIRDARGDMDAARERLNTGTLTKQEEINALNKNNVADENAAGAISFKTIEGEQRFMTPAAPKPNFAAENLEIRKQQVAAQQDSNAITRQNDQENKRLKAIDDFQKSKEVLEAGEKFGAAKFVSDLVSSGRPISAAVAKRQLFRLSGDVGAIRENDLKDLGASPSLAQRAELAWASWANGDSITREAASDIQATLKLIQQKNESVIRNKAGRTAEKYASVIKGLDKDELLEQYNVDSYFADRIVDQQEETDPILEEMRRRGIQ